MNLEKPVLPREVEVRESKVPVPTYRYDWILRQHKLCV